MARAKVLFVHHRPELGGAPTSLSYLVGALDRDRYEIHVYCPAGPAAELLRAAGARVHVGPTAAFTHIWASTYSGRRWLLLARELARLPRHWRAFSRLLRDEGFDIVHLNDSPLVAAAWMARRSGARVVWHLRASLPGDGSDLRSRLLAGSVAMLADRAIAINEDVAASFGVPQTETVHNSVDLDRFAPGDPRPAREALGLDPDRPVVSFFGFLYPLKGYREFIEAAAAARRRGVDASFVLVGGGVRDVSFFRSLPGRLLDRLGLISDYVSDAASLVDALDLEQYVHFVPFTSAPEDFYRASDVIVAPARGPELGRQTIEAAAAGRPVITTGSMTGAGVVLPGETGILLRHRGVEALAGAIADLLADEDRRRRIGEAARAHAEAHFSTERNADRISGIYEELLRAPPERRSSTLLAPRPQRPGGLPRVLYVHHRPQLGGAPLSLAYLIRELGGRYEVHAYSPPGPAAELFRRMGARVHPGPTSIFVHVWDAYSGLRWALMLRELALLPGHLVSLAHVIRRNSIEIVHLNDSPLLAAGVLARMLGTRVVWHVRGTLYSAGRDRRSRAIARIIDACADSVIAIDSDVAPTFPLRTPIHVIPNSTDVGPPPPPPDGETKAALGLDPNAVTVGFFGYVRRQKGWPELVEAARILIERGSHIQFVVLGGGVRAPSFFASLRGRVVARLGIVADEESELRDLVRRYHIEHAFRFASFTADTGSVYRALDLVAFPNQETGLGRPVLEAAAAARPAVASGSVSGAEVLVPGKTGLLVAQGHPEELAEAIGMLAADPELRRSMGRGAYELAEERFDPARNAAAVAEIYDRLLARSPMPEHQPERVG